MNFDDSQLSAFFDEELDPGDRQLVAWNVESSPEMLQQLVDFRSVQTAIAGLDRPSIPLDLSATVLLQLTHAQPRRGPSLGQAGRFAAMIVGMGSVAASLLVALFLLYRPLHDDPGPALFADGNAAPAQNLPHTSVSTATSPAASRVEAPAIASKPPAPRTLRTQANVPAQASILSVGKASGVGGPDPARPGQVDAMLGHRKVLRALIVTDVLDRTSEQVRTLIEQDAAREPEFGRITLAQGIVIDPDQPGQAEVYSVVMSQASTEPFLRQLARAFPDVRIEPEAAPATVSHLTEVGQVAVFSGVRPAPLGAPPDGISQWVAAKGAAAAGYFPPPAPLLDPLQGGELVTSARRAPVSLARGTAKKAQDELSAAEADVAQEPGLGPDDEPVTVLVWVARQPRPR